MIECDFEGEMQEERNGGNGIIRENGRRGFKRRESEQENGKKGERKQIDKESGRRKEIKK